MFVVNYACMSLKFYLRGHLGVPDAVSGPLIVLLIL